MSKRTFSFFLLVAACSQPAEVRVTGDTPVGAGDTSVGDAAPGGDDGPGDIDAGDPVPGDNPGGDPTPTGDVDAGDPVPGDNSGGDTTPADPSAFTVCANAAQPWGTNPGFVYRCVTPCPDPTDFDSCAWDSTGDIDIDYASRSLYFAVEGMGGTLRFATNGGPTALFHKGEKGTGWIGNTYLRDRLQAAGGRPVEVSWEADALTGWFTRPDLGSASTLREVSRRPAAVIAWVHDHLSGNDTFGTVGCSGGSMATYYARYWNPIDPILDYQLFMGGPPLASAFWACAGRQGCGSNADQECGRCRLNAANACGVVDGCALGSCSPYVLTASVKMIDQLHMTGTTCEQGGTDPSYSESGHVTSSGDASFEHPVDFVVNTNVGGFGDDDIGIFAAAYEIYIGTSGPRTWTVESGFHCETQGSPASCEKLLTGLGLWTGTIGLCP